MTGSCYGVGISGNKLKINFTEKREDCFETNMSVTKHGVY